MSLVGILTSSFIAWIILAVVNAKFGLLNKVGLKIGQKMQFWGIIVCGALLTGFLGTALSGVGLPTHTGDTTGVDSFAIKDATWSQDAMVNNASDCDYYTDKDKTVTLYITDVNITDDQYLNATLVVDRVNSEKGGSIEIVCESLDFSKSGTVYNIVSKDSSDDIELTIAGGGKADGTRVSKNIDFAEADSSETVNILAKQDETAEDILSVKDSRVITCTVGGQSARIVAVAND